MRSRYSGYVLARKDYLLRTWHESTRPETLDLRDAGTVRWLGLKIVRTEAGGSEDMRGVVEFVARYQIGGLIDGNQTTRFITQIVYARLQAAIATFRKQGMNVLIHLRQLFLLQPVVVA
jgi:SEC-C motif-containing protein